MRIRFALDSGAYSIYTTRVVGYDEGGTLIKGAAKKHHHDYGYYRSKEFRDYLDDYVEYTKWFGKALDWFVTLDAIYNSPETDRILDIFAEHKVVPMPVHHYGQDMMYLKKWAKKYPYIGIGAGTPDSTLHRWLQHGHKVFEYLGDTKDVKTHGFALNAFQLVTAFPWTSMDNTSPSIHGRFGNLMLPRMYTERGIARYDYSRINSLVVVSAMRERLRNHYVQHGKENKKLINDYLLSLGSSLDEVRHSHAARDMVNYVWVDRFLRQYENSVGHAAPRFWKSGKYSSAPTLVPYLIKRMADNGVKELNYLGTYFRLDGMRVINKLLDEPLFLTQRQMRRALRNGREPIYQSLQPRFWLTSEIRLPPDNEPLLLSDRPKLIRPRPSLRLQWGNGDDSGLAARPRLRDPGGCPRPTLREQHQEAEDRIDRGLGTY